MQIDGSDMVFGTPVPGGVLSGGKWRLPWTLENAINLTFAKIPCISPMPRDYKYPRRNIDPYDFQVQGSDFLVRNRRGYMLADMGCVDGSTEYLSPDGWKRIDEYEGGPVAQFDIDSGQQTWAKPSRYIKLPCSEMYHFHTTRGIDQMLSPEHRVLYTENGIPRVATAEDIAAEDAANSHGFRGKIPTVFRGVGGPGLPLSESELRVQVAVMADGYFPSNARRVRIRIKKPRKIERLRLLLRQAGIRFIDRPCAPEGYRVFAFLAPMRAKNYEGLWAATATQLQTIISEIEHWDGTAAKNGRGIRFFSRKKESADFVQYALHATGHCAKLNTVVRDDGGIGYELRSRGTQQANLEVRGFDSAGVKRECITKVPAPGGMKYCFTVPSGFLVLRRNGCVFVTGNCGKTIMALWASDYLLSTGMIKKVLIVCPKNIMWSAWVEDLTTHLPHLKHSVITGTKAQKARAAAKPAQVYIINHDGIHYTLDLLNTLGIDLIIYDESTAIGDTGSLRHKATRRFLSSSMWLWEMTGTPRPQSPMVVHGQVRLMANIDQFGALCRPHIDPAPRFYTKTSWKSLTMTQLDQYRWEAREDANDTVFKFMQPAFRVSKAAVLRDIKEPVRVRREVDLTKDQIHAINELKAEGSTARRNERVTSANAAVLLSKIIQVSCGCAYGESDEPGEGDGERLLVEFPAKHKEDELLEVLSEAEHRKIVYVPYRSAVERVAEVCRKAGYKVATVTGSTKPKDFSDIMKKFQANAPDAVDVIVAIPQKMSHGVTATAADLTVWYAPVMRAEVYTQANNRMNRIGQDKFTRIVTIASHPVETALYKRLDDLNLSESALLNMYEAFIGGKL